MATEAGTSAPEPVANLPVAVDMMADGGLALKQEIWLPPQSNRIRRSPSRVAIGRRFAPDYFDDVSTVVNSLPRRNSCARWLFTVWGEPMDEETQRTVTLDCI